MVYGALMYDTHVHLSDPEYIPYIDAITQSMEKTHIAACCVSMDESDSARTLDLADKHKMILAFVGVHPEKASGGADNLLRITHSWNRRDRS